MSNVVPFALADRTIYTVESERHFVKVRHRTRWYAVARRKGEEDQRLHCRSRENAVAIAEMMREADEQMAFAEQVEAMLARLPPIQREQAMDRLRALAEEE